jgi:ATP-binding cassette subfamily F protein uup
MAERGYVRPRAAELQVAEAPRLSHVVLEAHGVAKALGGRPILTGIDFTLGRGERVGIVGPNGAGKTTFLRVLLGELAPDAGEVVTGKRSKIAYYDQARAQLDPETTVYEAAGGGPVGALGEDFIELSGRKVALRDYLDDLLFPVTMQRMKVKALSGGERNRLLLAKLFLEGANVLVLDEPTNDLDLVTLNVLERLLLGFDGAVLVVTHDRYFLDKVATAVLAIEGDGHAVRYPGNFEMYRTLKGQAERDRADAAALDGPRAAVRPERSEGESKGGARVRKPGKLSFNEQRELEGMEVAILAAEGRKAEIELQLSDPATYQKDGGRIASLKAELARVGAEVERLYARWQELEGLREAR